MNTFIVMLTTDRTFGEIVKYASEFGVSVSSVPVIVNEEEGEEFTPRTDIPITMDLIYEFENEGFGGICEEGVKRFILDCIDRGYSYLHHIWYDDDLMQMIRDHNANAANWIKEKLS